MLSRLKKIYDLITANEGQFFIYAFAYSLVLGLAPLLITAILLLGNVISIESLVTVLEQYLPRDIIVPFIEYIRMTRPSELMMFISAVVVSIWMGSKIVYSYLIYSSNILKIKINGFILRLVSIVVLLVLLFGVGAIVFVLSYIKIFNFIIYPLLVFLLLFTFYWIISFNKIKIRFLLLGSGVASIFFYLLGSFFFLYVNNMSNYQSVYGPLASIMILLIACYLISFIIYLGYCVLISFSDLDTELEKGMRL